MKLKQSLLRTAVFTTPLLLIFSGLSVNASESQPPTPKLMECVEITGYAKLGEDLSCKIANSHHRTEQYPEATFFYDLMPEACSDPDNPMVCCVGGMMWGTMGDHDFTAKAGCGFTVNDFAASDDGADAAEDLADIYYQQFTARTLMRVFLNTTELPVHPSGDEDREVKADFGLFLGDAGVSRDDFFVSQRMTLTGARKLPRGTKMKLDMVGLPPVREISGTMCGPNLIKVLDNIAQTGPGGNDEKDD